MPRPGASRQHRAARLRQPPAPGLEEVTPRARMNAIEANVGRREPDDLGPGQHHDARRRRPPDGVGRVPVVGPDAAGMLVAAGGHDPRARQERAVDAERGDSALRRALAGSRRGRTRRAHRRDGRAQQQKQRKRPHRGRGRYGLAVRVSVMRAKNWSSIIRETPPSIRCPTLAMSPPIWTSAL